MHADVVSIHVLPRQFKEFVLVLPTEGVFLELLCLIWWQRWLGDLGDQICRRCFSQTIDQDTHKRDLNEYVKPKSKTKKDTRAVLEPQLLLLLVVADAREVWFEL